MSKETQSSAAPAASPLPSEWLDHYGALKTDEELASAWVHGAGNHARDRIAEISLTALIGFVRKQ